MNKYKIFSRRSKRPMEPKMKVMRCNSECCQGRETKHDPNDRTNRFGVPLFTCRNCGEERTL